MQTAHFIIDADILVYEACASCEKTVTLDNNLYYRFAGLEETQARYEEVRGLWLTGAKQALAEAGLVDPARVRWQAHDVFSNPDRSLAYRKSLPHVEYKAARLGMQRPIVAGLIEEWAIQKYTGFYEEKLEGDDMCGLYSTAVLDQPESIAVIISKDKDLLTVPGYVWNPMQKEFTRVDEEAAMRNFYMQVLAGDRVDGYFGIPNMGPVGAAKVLEKAYLTGTDVWDAIVAAYAKKGLGEEVALSNARCAWILRDGDYDFETREVRLWDPRR